MKYIYNDGGAGTNKQRDCVVRAVAIATGKPYAEVRDTINHLADEVFRRVRCLSRSEEATVQRLP